MTIKQENKLYKILCGELARHPEGIDSVILDALMIRILQLFKK